jgi:hypothetical protein
MAVAAKKIRVKVNELAAVIAGLREKLRFE